MVLNYILVRSPCLTHWTLQTLRKRYLFRDELLIIFHWFFTDFLASFQTAPCNPSPLSSFDTHASWQPVTQSAWCRRYYGKIVDCEQSNVKLDVWTAGLRESWCFPRQSQGRHRSGLERKQNKLVSPVCYISRLSFKQLKRITGAHQNSRLGTYNNTNLILKSTEWMQGRIQDLFFI